MQEEDLAPRSRSTPSKWLRLVLANHFVRLKRLAATEVRRGTVEDPVIYGDDIVVVEQSANVFTALH